jgi:hypothetical protein
MPAPSLSHLASVLSKPDRVQAEPQVVVRRPEPLVRMALVGVLTLLLSLAIGILALGLGMQGLVGAVREQRRDLEHQARVAVPEPAVLLDEQAFARDLAQRPLAAPVLFAARARVLGDAARWPEIIAMVDQAAISRPHDLAPAAWLWQAVALERTGDLRRAAQVLHAVDGARLDEADRVRAADLAGRLWMVTTTKAP